VAGRFSGRRVLVTGGGTGLGLALARRFAVEGAKVVVAGRRVDKLAEASAAVRADGGEAEAVVLDVADPRSVREAFSTLAASGTLDVVVLNAGVAAFGPFEDLAEADVSSMIAINLEGAIRCARAALPLFPPQGGVLVATASLAVRRTFRNCSVYAATKAGLVAFMDVAREELRSRGIRCLTAIPGPVDTPIWDRLSGDFPRDRMMSAHDAAAAIADATLLGGTACVEEIVLLPEGGPL
jgi:NAD(P)-dependent dehydrogenase (short-subunit alcohol dehydrogenase family)